MKSRIPLQTAGCSPGSASRRVYMVGTPMNTVACGSRRSTSLWVEPGAPDHLAAIEQCAMDGHEQAMHMEDGQGMQQHVTALVGVRQSQ